MGRRSPEHVGHGRDREISPEGGWRGQRLGGRYGEFGATEGGEDLYDRQAGYSRHREWDANPPRETSHRSRPRRDYGRDESDWVRQGHYRESAFGDYGVSGGGVGYGPGQGNPYGSAIRGEYDQGRVMTRPAHMPSRAMRRGPKGYQRSDERIQEDIYERLIEREHLDVEDIRVDVKDGHVTLEGEVPERWMKHEIEDIADACMGVKDVNNDIRVKRGLLRTLFGSDNGGK